MGIYQKGKNWYIDYYFKGRRKRKKVGPSKKLAEQVLKDVQLKIAKGEYLGIYEEKKILFDDFAKEYLEYARTNKSFSTYHRRDRVSVNHLKETFQGRYLHEITPKMIEEYKTQRLNEVTSTTINKEIGCLKHMYTKALEWGYLKRNPTKEVKLLKQPPGRLRYLEREEINNLLDACAPHLRPIIVAGLNTGMRKGEILNLKWSDVDLKNRRITLTNTKNNEIRIIPINDTFYQELINLKDNSQGEYVFCNAKKKPFSDIKKAFVSALKRAGIKDFRFHDLRHTFGSHLVMKGVDLRTVQQLLGHKDIKMTMRYSHLSPGHLQEAVGKLDRL
ncbi:MAG: tyrosine-type recombinase/integrase [Nitrospirota bacterium]